MTPNQQEAFATLREFALSLPEAYKGHPWGETAVKVHKKGFIYFGFIDEERDPLRMSVKLPESREEALCLPFAQATGYKWGNHGWVTFTFQAEEHLPVMLLVEWIEESYRAIAPKRLVVQLDGLASSEERQPTP